MGISIEISMEDYFESLNENDKLAYRTNLYWKVAKLSQVHSFRNDWIEMIGLRNDWIEMIGLKMLMLFLRFHGEI